MPAEMKTLSEDALWLLEVLKMARGRDDALPLPTKNERRLVGLGLIRQRNGEWVLTQQGEQMLLSFGYK
jgi:hypothetical protein